MTVYTPNRWLVLKTPDCYKVFGTWAGGYTTGDEWRLNSGITEITELDEYTLSIKGFSGSEYRVHRDCYGIAGAYNYGVLDSIVKSGMEVLSETTDWLNLVEKNNG